jgi:ketosteroid isomerase-like protein
VPEDRVDRLRDLYEEWGRGNFRVGGELLADDVEFRPLDGITERVRGRAAFADFLRDVFESFSGFRLVAHEFVDEGDRVLVRVTQRAQGRESGLDVELEYRMEWVFGPDGKVVRFGSADEPR